MTPEQRDRRTAEYHKRFRLANGHGDEDDNNNEDEHFDDIVTQHVAALRVYGRIMRSEPAL